MYIYIYITLLIHAPVTINNNRSTSSTQKSPPPFQNQPLLYIHPPNNDNNDNNNNNNSLSFRYPPPSATMPGSTLPADGLNGAVAVGTSASPPAAGGGSPPPQNGTCGGSGGGGSGGLGSAAEAMRKSPPRARLTEQEKKSNHIASEQKRRNAIRDGFDRLTELIPGCEGQGRSEGMVLNRSMWDFLFFSSIHFPFPFPFPAPSPFYSCYLLRRRNEAKLSRDKRLTDSHVPGGGESEVAIEFINDELRQRRALIDRIESLGGTVPPELRDL